jgi:hypothetical protein
MAPDRLIRMAPEKPNREQARSYWGAFQGVYRRRIWGQLRDQGMSE